MEKSQKKKLLRLLLIYQYFILYGQDKRDFFGTIIRPTEKELSLAKELTEYVPDLKKLLTQHFSKRVSLDFFQSTLFLMDLVDKNVEDRDIHPIEKYLHFLKILFFFEFGFYENEETLLGIFFSFGEEYFCFETLEELEENKHLGKDRWKRSMENGVALDVKTFFSFEKGLPKLNFANQCASVWLQVYLKDKLVDLSTLEIIGCSCADCNEASELKMKLIPLFLKKYFPEFIFAEK